jgi:DNA-binding NarL/FixJ family response regulator
VAETEASVGPPMVYVGVVDDNTFYRDWLGQVGTLSPHHHVVARGADAHQLTTVLTRLPDSRCDVVLLDLRIARGPGADPVHGGGAGPAPVQGSAAVELLLNVAREAVAAGHLQRVPAILVYTQELAPRVHVACLIAGAAGVVLKSAPLEELSAAIDVVAAGGLVVDERMANLIELLAHQHRLDLTDVETSILALAGHGLTRHQIARRLDSTESTVDKHLRSIRDKFGNDVHLTDLADAFGLRDLALPKPVTAKVQRHRLRDLAQRLAPRR